MNETVIQRRNKLAELIAESSQLLHQSLLINARLTDLQAKIELQVKKLLDGTPSSHEIQIVDPAS